MSLRFNIAFIITLLVLTNCKDGSHGNNSSAPLQQTQMTAAEILSNPECLAISYGGYRKHSRDIQPSIAELKEDLRIMAAMNIKILRTYNTGLAQASNILKAIEELKALDPSFEMYVMLGAWINCENAFTDNPIHDNEDLEGNTAEIERAVSLANQYPDFVKVIAVGNEAMVKWAASYFVQPGIILRWVNHLQTLKKNGKLPQDLWITSSDNFVSWGGGERDYHTEDLNNLIKAVDYVSMHTYPMHDTHYNPDFWGVSKNSNKKTKKAQIEEAMEAATTYAKNQYQNVASYVRSIDSTKAVHIGETGWASYSNGFYGDEGSKATDEYKEAIYYKKMRSWTSSERIACFYFEAFDEIWKDAANAGGSENHFGLFTVDGKAKYALWELADQGVFDGLTRNGKPVSKTFEGNQQTLLNIVKIPSHMK